MNASDGGPAFPRPMGWNGLSHHEEHESNEAQEGLSLRDYFAAHAPLIVPMEYYKLYYGGMPPMGGVTPEECLKIIFAWGYYYADAMLAARERKP
jgi:hypothetical protein